MSMVDELKELGIDVDDAMQRFMGNQGLLERMLKKLPPVVKDQQVMQYLESGDYDTALANAHTLKGVTGNLSIMPLYEAYNDIVSSLRENNPERAKQRMEEILSKQEQVVACIEKYI